MPTTYNYDITRNAAVSEAIAYESAGATDRVYAVFRQSGIMKAVKRTANYYGDTLQIAITAGVGYTVTLNPADTDEFEAGVAAEYKIYSVNDSGTDTEIINGTLTVNERAGGAVPDYIVRQSAVMYVDGTEMPDAADYAAGTIVSKDGVLYVQEDGEWEVTWVGESIPPLIISNFDEADSYKLKPSALKSNCAGKGLKQDADGSLMLRQYSNYIVHKDAFSINENNPLQIDISNSAFLIGVTSGMWVKIPVGSFTFTSGYGVMVINMTTGSPVVEEWDWNNTAGYTSYTGNSSISTDIIPIAYRDINGNVWFVHSDYENRIELLETNQTVNKNISLKGSIISYDPASAQAVSAINIVKSLKIKLGNYDYYEDAMCLHALKLTNNGDGTYTLDVWFKNITQFSTDAYDWYFGKIFSYQPKREIVYGKNISSSQPVWLNSEFVLDIDFTAGESTLWGGESILLKPIPENDKSIDAYRPVVTKYTSPQWDGKRIVWYGTSIPEGGGNTLSYPAYAAFRNGAVIHNEAKGSSMARIAKYDGSMVGCYASNIMWSLGHTIAEKQSIIDHWTTGLLANGTIDAGGTYGWKDLLVSAPSTLTAQQELDMIDCSYENRIVARYLDNTSPNFVGVPDLFVFDHGHNDLVTSSYDLDNASAIAVPSTRNNRNYYIGAMNYLIDVILSYYPRARIAFIGHYENDRVPRIAQAQQNLFSYWNFPSLKLWEKLGWTQQINTNTGLTMTNTWMPLDNLHPYSGDNVVMPSGFKGAVELIGQHCSEFLNVIY